jgi:electron transfer flavoprotein beta subunit
MKIAVCIKQSPARDAALRPAPGGAWIEETDLAFEMNEPDAYALEEGLQLKDQHGGEVVVVCLGPARAAQTIREALAKGADRAIHIECGAVMVDPLATSQVIAAALRPEQPDLILTGLQSDDLGYGQTGVVLAELLGIPHATIIMQVERDGSTLVVKRELEDGWFQRVRLPLPALLTIQSGIRKLRYATLMGIKRAKTKEIKRLAAEDLGGEPGAGGIAVERVYLPEKSKQAQRFTGDPKEAAARVVEKLRFEARVL